MVQTFFPQLQKESWPDQHSSSGHHPAKMLQKCSWDFGKTLGPIYICFNNNNFVVPEGVGRIAMITALNIVYMTNDLVAKLIV